MQADQTSLQCNLLGVACHQAQPAGCCCHHSRQHLHLSLTSRETNNLLSSAARLRPKTAAKQQHSVVGSLSLKLSQLLLPAELAYGQQIRRRCRCAALSSRTSPWLCTEFSNVVVPSEIIPTKLVQVAPGAPCPSWTGPDGQLLAARLVLLSDCCLPRRECWCGRGRVCCCQKQ